MKRNFKRFGVLFMAIFTIFCLTVSASAEEVLPENSEEVQGQLVTFEVTSDGVVQIDSDGNITPRSSISGYGAENVTNDNWLMVPVQSEGVGGMGITVKTSSSWNGYMSMLIVDAFDTVYVENYAIYSNDEKEFHDLTNYYPVRFYFIFDGIPDGESVYVQAWIYG